MTKAEGFKRICDTLARDINIECQTFVAEIRYKEFLHNVSYENGVCYCEDPNERRLECSEIEICRYKNRIKVTMIVGSCSKLTNRQINAINKLLGTNVQYTELRTGYTEVSFNVNPHSKYWFPLPC